LREKLLASKSRQGDLVDLRLLYNNQRLLPSNRAVFCEYPFDLAGNAFALSPKVVLKNIWNLGLLVSSYLSVELRF
jgi:hypothetical protein